MVMARTRSSKVGSYSVSGPRRLFVCPSALRLSCWPSAPLALVSDHLMAPLASWRRFVVPCVQLQRSGIHSAVTLGRFRRAKTAQQGLGTVLCNQAEWLEWFEYGGTCGPWIVGCGWAVPRSLQREPHDMYFSPPDRSTPFLRVWLGLDEVRSGWTMHRRLVRQDYDRAGG
ncbi:hypothetical protein BGZ61DRAFT_454760 [Ilyonectria robusta]|uniref:uncharacterized protein n=1 Tax=Ilyonectria robusta TaxID=1079257 RepID=UPI001E8CCADF|nr:uncharacterized protein BGZ61DRAFT_454760 [Ilyonectria robusta]KAH8686614.1 hypothetical protein BGZ61DRAFT_454760 [Ilyonectria robusta]